MVTMTTATTTTMKPQLTEDDLQDPDLLGELGEVSGGLEFGDDTASGGKGQGGGGGAGSYGYGDEEDDDDDVVEPDQQSEEEVEDDEGQMLAAYSAEGEVRPCHSSFLQRGKERKGGRRGGTGGKTVSSSFVARQRDKQMGPQRNSHLRPPPSMLWQPNTLMLEALCTKNDSRRVAVPSHVRDVRNTKGFVV